MFSFHGVAIVQLIRTDYSLFSWYKYTLESGNSSKTHTLNWQSAKKQIAESVYCIRVVYARQALIILHMNTEQNTMCQASEINGNKYNSNEMEAESQPLDKTSNGNEPSQRKGRKTRKVLRITTS